jgi:amino acid transporter
VHSEKIGLWSAVSIGIGGMVGGGIFAVLGLAVQLSGGATPFAFFLAGAVALITSYSYAKLSVKYPSQGGTVEFLNRAFGDGIFTGSLNVLLWISYIVMLSLYSYAFGSYAASFFPHQFHVFYRHIFTTLIIIALTILNLMSAGVVGEVEEYIVAFKVAILMFFVVAGLWSIKLNRFYQHVPPAPELIAGGMVIFLAYEGFELIANTAMDIEDLNILPKAYYIAVGFVVFLYVAVAIVTVGNLPFQQIINARDYALAAAAKPFLGEAGFTLIAIAALLSTGSAINATLYGSARVSYIIAKYGELPKFLERKVWSKPVEGLLLTSALTLVMANTLRLSNISTLGSAGFLIIFAMVNIANLKLRKTTGANPLISGTGSVMCFLALLILLAVTVRCLTDMIVFLVIVCSSFAFELIYRSVKKLGKKNNKNM